MVSVAPGACQARCVTSWGSATPWPLRPLVPRSLRAPSSQLALRSRPQPPRSPGRKVQVSTCCGAGGRGGREGGGDRCAGGELGSVTQPPPGPVPPKGGDHTPSRLASGCGRLPPPHRPLEVFWPDSPSRLPTRSQQPESPAPNPQPSKLEQLRSLHWGPNTRGRAHGGSWAWSLGSPEVWAFLGWTHLKQKKSREAGPSPWWPGRQRLGLTA